jgi:uncharacterized protein (DUF1501 family)
MKTACLEGNVERESVLESRRAFLFASGVWLAVEGLPKLVAGEDRDRALVCVYVMAGGSDVELANSQRINPAMPEVEEIFAAGAAAIVSRVAAPVGSGPSPEQRYSAVRFLANGALTPKWASPESSVVATLPSGLTVASGSAADAGALASAAATASFRTAFPETGIGRQLRDAAAVLRLRKSFGLTKPVLTLVVSGFRLGQLSYNDRILADLSRSLGAFYQAMLELNIAKQVTTCTDMDFGASPVEGRAQLVMGGSVHGGRVFSGATRGTSYEAYTATLMRWPGSAPTVGLHEPMGFLD